MKERTKELSQSEEAPDHIWLARDAATGVEAVRARFGGHAYDLHRHDDWLVGVTDHGVQDFFCRGARHKSTSGRVILIEPGEAHDGQAGTAGGFSYSMLYLPQRFVPSGGFRATLADDALLGPAIRTACRHITPQASRLARDAALDIVVEYLRPHLGVRQQRRSTARNGRIATRARDRLHAAIGEDIGADALATAAGADDRFRLARAFRAEFGSAPHEYLVQIRLVAARRLLARGDAPAKVAAQCGFADQSHFGRWFRRAYGITPGTYRACCTAVPDDAA